MQKNKTLDQIADELEESIEIIQPIYDIVKKHAPEYAACNCGAWLSKLLV